MPNRTDIACGGPMDVLYRAVDSRIYSNGIVKILQDWTIIYENNYPAINVIPNVSIGNPVPESPWIFAKGMGKFALGM